MKTARLCENTQFSNISDVLVCTFIVEAVTARSRLSQLFFYDSAAHAARISDARLTDTIGSDTSIGYAMLREQQYIKVYRPRLHSLESKNEKKYVNLGRSIRICLVLVGCIRKVIVLLYNYTIIFNEILTLIHLS